MIKEVIKFYSNLRQIFGVCPCCGELFRLSDCKLYQKTRPRADWKERLEKEISRLDQMEERILDKIELAREAERARGRREADKLVRKIDPIFRPLRLNPNDAKVVFHPVDFVVFNGMNSFSGSPIKNVVLLDKDEKEGEFKLIQQSVEAAVGDGKYQWLTLRVGEDGSIAEE